MKTSIQVEVTYDSDKDSISLVFPTIGTDGTKPFECKDFELQEQIGTLIMSMLREVTYTSEKDSISRASRARRGRGIPATNFVEHEIQTTE